MREAVQLAAAEVVEVVVDVAVVAVDSVAARATGRADRAIEAQKGVIFMVTSVGKEINVHRGLKLGEVLRIHI
jgi:hypothetical protein